MSVILNPFCRYPVPLLRTSTCSTHCTPSTWLTISAICCAIAGVAAQVWPEARTGAVNLSIYGGQQVIQAGVERDVEP